MAEKTAVVIPNYNGLKYNKDCLDAMRLQRRPADRVIVIDNGSEDGSAEEIERDFPEVELVRMGENTGFCGAVNKGIELSSDCDYVILLNNDTKPDRDFVGELIRGMKRHPGAFSGQAKMLRMSEPDKMDDAGDLYCALGWSFARGKGKPESRFSRPARIFSCCAGAAIYRMDVIRKIGVFDENHFAYLEDLDIGWRARIEGYKNIYIPTAKVLHVGSATSGSIYNLFKVKNTSRNSIYVIYKNMPLLQILINLPLLIPGFLVKQIFFAKKGFGLEYAKGLAKGVALSIKGGKEGKKVRYEKKNLINYIEIQFELWINVIRRLGEAF